MTSGPPLMAQVNELLKKKIKKNPPPSTIKKPANSDSLCPRTFPNRNPRTYFLVRLLEEHARNSPHSLKVL